MTGIGADRRGLFFERYRRVSIGTTHFGSDAISSRAANFLGDAALFAPPTDKNQQLGEQAKENELQARKEEKDADEEEWAILNPFPLEPADT